MTAMASRIWGMAVGWTKEMASMRWRPVAARRSMNSTFLPVST